MQICLENGMRLSEVSLVKVTPGGSSSRVQMMVNVGIHLFFESFQLAAT